MKNNKLLYSLLAVAIVGIVCAFLIKIKKVEKVQKSKCK